MESRSLDARGPIKGVLFDLDNTLYDRDQTFQLCAGGFVEEHFADLLTILPSTRHARREEQ